MKMKTGLALATLGAVALAGASQAQAQPARTFPVQVEAGETFLLEMNLSSDAAGFGSFGYEASLGLEIEEMGPNGGVWRWSIEDLRLVPPASPADPSSLNPFAALPYGPGLDQALSAGVRLMTDLDFVCRVDAYGTCLEVLNWPQWRERAENAVLLTSGILLVLEEQQEQTAAMMDQIAGPTPPYKPEYVPSYRADAPASVAPPEVYAPYQPEPVPYAAIAQGMDNVAGVVLDSIDGRMIASWMNYPGLTAVPGGSFAVGDETPVTASYQLPFGAQPLQYSGAVTLTGVDRSAGVARFSRTMSIDSAAFSSSITSLLTNATPPIMAALAPALPEGAMGEDPNATATFMVSMVSAMMASMNFNLQETGTFEVDMATGLIRAGEMRQTMTMQMPDGTSMGDQVTTMSFTLRPAPLNQPRLGAAGQ